MEKRHLLLYPCKNKEPPANMQAAQSITITKKHNEKETEKHSFAAKVCNYGRTMRN
jgi:hypothetical protein